MENGRWGVIVFALISVGGMIAIGVVLRIGGWPLGSYPGLACTLIGMWLPAIGRFVATRTVDRGFQSPMPLRKWGSSKALVIIVPLATIVAIYSLAYGVAAFIGVEHEPPRWVELKRIAINLAITGVIHGTLTLFGALGEELGWRGYMLPRLDQMGVRFVASMAAGLRLPRLRSGANHLVFEPCRFPPAFGAAGATSELSRRRGQRLHFLNRRDRCNLAHFAARLTSAGVGQTAELSGLYSVLNVFS